MILAFEAAVQERNVLSDTLEHSTLLLQASQFFLDVCRPQTVGGPLGTYEVLPSAEVHAGECCDEGGHKNQLKLPTKSREVSL